MGSGSCCGLACNKIHISFLGRGPHCMEEMRQGITGSDWKSDALGPRGSKFSMLHTVMQLSFQSRTTCRREDKYKCAKKRAYAPQC